MSLYPLAAQPTSASPAPSKVPPWDQPSQADFTKNTSDVAERIKLIKETGLACLGHIHGDFTWEDWRGVGAALLIITEEALVATGSSKWDPYNKRLVNEFNARWEKYEAGVGKNHKPLSKQERSALREVMANPEISAYRETLTGADKRYLSHPKTVLARFKAKQKAKTPPDGDREPSPHAKLKATNIELQEELHRLNQHSGGSVFNKSDSPKTIATAIIGTFDGMSNKFAKVEAIVRELNAHLKMQRKAAS